MKDASSGFEQEQHYYRLLRLAEYYESQFILQTPCASQDSLTFGGAETPMSVAEARHACEYYYHLYRYHL